MQSTTFQDTYEQTPQLRSIASLPPELLSQIFTHCLPSDTFLLPSRLAAPILLTQISRLWRTTAFSTPLLWASLDATVDTMTRTWLARAGALPLRLRLSVPEGVETLGAHIARSRELSLRIPSPALSFLLLGETYPFLERLSIEVTQTGVPPPSKHDISFPPISAPHLRVLTLSSPFPFPPLLPFPWHDLHTLSLKAPGTYSWLPILHHCSALTSLSIHFTSHLGPRLTPNPTRLPSLQTLAIVCRNGVSTDALLDYLSTPSLLHLRAHVRTASVPPVRSVISLLTRSSCRLEDLHIDGVAGFFGAINVPENVHALLTLLPHLKTLHVTCTSHGYLRTAESFLNSTLHALAKRAPDEPFPFAFLPSLRDLSVSLLVDFAKIQGDEVGSVLQARKEMAGSVVVEVVDTKGGGMKRWEGTGESVSMKWVPAAVRMARPRVRSKKGSLSVDFVDF